MPNDYKPPIAVDFDDCIFDKKNERLFVGAAEFLRELHKKYFVVIFSSRASQPKSKNILVTYLREQKLMGVINEVTDKKHLNFSFIIDNKAVKCRGTQDFRDVLAEVGL